MVFLAGCPNPVPYPIYPPHLPGPTFFFLLKRSHNIGQVLSVESLSKGSELVASGSQKVEQRDHSTLKLSTSSSVDGGRAESLPDNGLANIGGNKQRNTRTKSIAFLKELVQKKNDKSGNEELNDDEKAHAHAHLAWNTVHTGHDVDDSLATRER